MNKLVFGFLLLLFACKSNQQLNGQEDNSSSEPLSIIINPEYRPGDIVVFIIENNTDSSVYVFEPSRLDIEREIDSSWHDLRILPCPCGAPCAPPRYIELGPYEHMDINWNQKETWCKGGNVPGHDESEYVRRGTYRFVLKVNDSGEKDQVDDQLYYAEFKIL